MPELQFSISLRVVFIIAAGLCSVAGALYVYRITVPPVSSVKRIILITLRSVVLFLLFLLIGEPILLLIMHNAEPPVVDVLIDNSQSMAIRDKSGARDEKLKSIFKSDVWQQLKKTGIINYSLFDAGIHNLTGMPADSLTFRGEATDIAKAFKSVKQTSTSSNIQALVLITDGNPTIGLNPIYEAEDLNIPVFTIGVGDTIEQKDILVRKILTNEIAYLGNKVPVNAMIHSTGFAGERIQVSLHEGSKLIDEKTLSLESGSRDYIESLSFIPGKEGMHKYEIDISSLPGELTDKNNHMSFFTKILKNKMRVLLIAGSPSEDVAGIQNVISNDKNIELKTFIERENGQFYEGELNPRDLAGSDCIILIGFPSANSSSKNIDGILNSKKPLMTVLSRTMNYDKLRALEPLLPFSIISIGVDELQVFAGIPESERSNSILKIGGVANSNDAWSKLPPVFQLKGVYKAKTESEVLATVRFQTATSKDPFIIARNVNKSKSLSVLGYGLWRWNLLSGSGTGSDKVLENFLGNALRWLTTQEDAKRITIQPIKHIFTTQEGIEFTGQVYDESFQPIDDAQVEIKICNGNNIIPLVLNPLGSGQYQGAFDQLAEGEYKFSAKAEKNGGIIGEDQGVFSVGGYNAEFVEIRMNKLLLEQIAAQTGGRYYESNRFDSLSQDINSLPNFKARDISKKSEIEIWNSGWILGVVVLLFSLEWLLRKRNGML